MDLTNNKIIKVNLITLIPQSNNNGLLYLIKKKCLVHMSQQELNYIQSSIHTNGVFDTSTYKISPYYLFKPVFKKILNDKSLKVKDNFLILSVIVVGDKPEEEEDDPRVGGQWRIATLSRRGKCSSAAGT